MRAVLCLALSFVCVLYARLVAAQSPLLETAAPTPQLVALPLDGDGNVILDSLTRLLKNNRGQEVLAHIASFPSDLQELFDIAHCKARALAQVGRYLDSEEVLRRLIDDAQVDDENRFSAQLTLAKLCVALRRFDEAAAALRQLLERQPTNAEAWLYLGKVYLQQPEPNVARAKDCLARAVQLNHVDERTAFEYALVLVQQGDAAGAREAFELAARFNPAIDHKYLARIYVHLQRVDWAAGECRLANSTKTLGSTPATSPAATQLDEAFHLLWARVEDQEGFSERAIELYRLVLQQSPRNVAALVARGLLLLGLGAGSDGAPLACGLRQDEALQHFRLALPLSDGSDAHEALLSRVRQAVAFCRDETREADAWRIVVDRDVSPALAAAPPAPTTQLEAWDPTRVPSASSDAAAAPPSPTVEAPRASFWQRALLDPLRRLFSAAAETDATPPPPTAAAAVTGAASASESPAVSPLTQRALLMRQNWERRAARLAALHHRDALAVVEIVDDAASAADSAATFRGDVSPRRVTAAQFHREFVLRGRPAIVTNLQTRWASWLQSPAPAALLDTLSQHLGERLVRVSLAPDGVFGGREPAGRWGLRDADVDVAVQPAQQTMLLRDFVALLRAASSASAAPPVAALAAAAAVEQLDLQQYVGEALAALLPLPFRVVHPVERYVAQSNETVAVADVAAAADDALVLRPLATLWRCSAGATVAAMRDAPHETLLSQVAGAAEVVLLPPTRAAAPRPIEGRLRFAYPDGFSREPLAAADLAAANAAARQRRAPQPPPAAADAEQTPGAVRVVLLPGESLYAPARWRREVQTLALPDAADEPAVAMAVSFAFAAAA